MLVQQKEQRHAERVAGDRLPGADVQHGQPKGQFCQIIEKRADGKRVDDDGRQRQQPFFPDIVRNERGHKRRERAKHDVKNTKKAEYVGQQAPDKKPGDCRRRKKRQYAQCLGDAHLQLTVADRRDGHCQREIDSGDDTRFRHEPDGKNFFHISPPRYSRCARVR